MLTRTDPLLRTLDRLKQERELRERAALLNKPVKLPPDPLVEVRVVESFLIGAPFAVPTRVAAVGETLKLPASLAADLAALGRAALASRPTV